MAGLTLTVEDSSALIHYDPAGAWTNPSDDPLSGSYSGQSFHSTSVKGATATIKFDGTGINVFSGTRPNYGSFKLTIDGNVVSEGDASSSKATFNHLIASSTNLPNGPHTAIFESTGDQVIDLDRVDILTELGPPGSTLNTQELDDSDPSVSYEPSDDAWSTNIGTIFRGNSLHFSDQPDASASVSWEGGSGFSVWTTTAPDHGDFELYLDGELLDTCGGVADTVSSLRTNILMYYNTNLGPGQHTLKLQATGEGGPFIDLDSVVVYSTSGGMQEMESVGFESRPSPLTPGIIAGIAIGALALLLVLLGLILFLLRRRRQKRGASTSISSASASKASFMPLDIEAGKKPEHSKKGIVVGLRGLRPAAPPLSSTSSFFALAKEGDDNDDRDTIISSSTGISDDKTRPELKPSDSPLSLTKQPEGLPVDNEDGMPYHIENRPARDHKSMHLEVVYPEPAHLNYYHGQRVE